MKNKINYAYSDTQRAEAAEFSLHLDAETDLAELEENHLMLLQQLKKLIDDDKLDVVGLKKKLIKLIKNNIYWDCEYNDICNVEFSSDDEYNEYDENSNDYDEQSYEDENEDEY